MKKNLFLLFLLSLTACQSENRNPNSFTITAFLKKQYPVLQNAKILKTSTLDEKTESRTLDKINWENELEIFRQADILNGSLRYRYDKIHGVKNTVEYKLQPNEKQLSVKSLKLTFGKDSTVTDMEAVIQKKNYLYESDKTLKMSWQKNEKGILQLKNYSISGTKKLIFSPRSNFLLKAEVLN